MTMARSSASGVCRPRVAVTGATGFVGRAFIEAMADRYELVGLSRAPATARKPFPHQWRRCDLFSLLDVERTLAGCRDAIYLVHSMMPSARLTQASFADLDLILADNFGRGAARAGVKHIVYVGGLLPEGQALSRHLDSRREVEQALGAYGVRVTSLRAGLVVGAEGSSFRILRRLVERLPVMLCPGWTRTRTQPIAIEDLVALIGGAIDHPEHQGKIHDVGGPDVLTYQEMIADVAALLGKNPRMVPVPAFSPSLSRLWVSLVTGASRSLVSPLVQSLRHEMVAGDRALQRALEIPGRPWREAARDALSSPSSETSASALCASVPVPTVTRERRRMLRRRRTVRSVQRLPRPEAASAEQIAHEYLQWLPAFLRHLLVVDVEGEEQHVARFRFRLMRRPLLVLELARERSNSQRALFYVTGGMLARQQGRTGRLEFRTVPDGRYVLAAIHEFTPALPWYIYLVSQALVHLLVMRCFGAHLRRVDARALPAAPRALPEAGRDEVAHSEPASA
ncbi:MAG: NAD-dependent epimerase/dehydratase family protein, partial [Myxococcota bacterium]